MDTSKDALSRVVIADLRDFVKSMYHSDDDKRYASAKALVDIVKIYQPSHADLRKDSDLIACYLNCAVNDKWYHGSISDLINLSHGWRLK